MILYGCPKEGAEWMFLWETETDDVRLLTPADCAVIHRHVQEYPFSKILASEGYSPQSGPVSRRVICQWPAGSGQAHARIMRGAVAHIEKVCKEVE